MLGAISWEFDCTPITQLVIEILKEYCAWFCQAIWLNLFLLLLSYFVNLISKNASQGEGCCIIVRDQYSFWGSTAALNCFFTQKSVSKWQEVEVERFALGNYLVAHICAWHHFLGVWLYSNYTIGHQNSERVLCLILPSRLVKSVSSVSILHCQSFLQECVSRRVLLHYSEGSVFILR